MMKPTMLCCLWLLCVAALQMVSNSGLVTRSTASFSLLVAAHRHQQDSVAGSSRARFDSTQGQEVEEMEEQGEAVEEKCRGLSRLGSRPPNCEHKCRGCVPCEAIQIPATTDHRALQYTNYEPEGWKCKCGSSFFDP